MATNGELLTCDASGQQGYPWISIVAVLVTVFFVRTGVAETAYWRVATDRLTVVANSSGERCSRLATQFIIFERALRELANLDADYQLPAITVYSLSQKDADRVLLSDADRKREATTRWRTYSKFLPGPDFNIAAIVDLASGSDDPLQSVLLLYAEDILVRGPTRNDSPWYQLGVANLMNGVIIRTDGSVLLNRNLPFEPVGNDKGGAHEQYDLPRLLGTRGSDLNAATDYRAFIRAASEWAQFGLLTTEQRRAQYRELATSMRQGTPAAEALKDAFGLSLEQIADQLKGGRWRQDARYRLTVPGVPVSVPVPARLESEDADVLLQAVAKRVRAQA